MLKIGEFSKLSQVTIATLHHYDDIGLLKPANVDKFTNHRYYSIDQLSRLHNIVALKELGLSLEQVHIMLDSNELSNEQITGMLVLKEAQVQQRLREEQARLDRIRFRLKMLKIEEAMPDLEVLVKKLDAVRVLHIRRHFSDWEEMYALAGEVQDACTQNNISFDDVYPINIMYSNDYRIEDIDVAFSVPISEKHTQDIQLATLGQMNVHVLEEVESAATYLHRGHPSPNKLQENLTILQRWMVAHNYTLANEYRFIWYRGPMYNLSPEESYVEIQHVIEVNDSPLKQGACSSR